MKDEELLSRVEQLRRMAISVNKASEDDSELASFSKLVLSWTEAVKEEANKPKCKFCGSTKVRFADQKELFSDAWTRVMVCGKCGRQSEAK